MGSQRHAGKTMGAVGSESINDFFRRWQPLAAAQALPNYGGIEQMEFALLNNSSLKNQK